MPDPNDPYGDPFEGSEPPQDEQADRGYDLSEPVETPQPPADSAPPQPHYAAPTDGMQCLNCGAGLAGATLGGHCPHCGAPIVSTNYSSTQSSGMAAASMILGIVGVVTAPGGFCCICATGIGAICGLLGVIFYFPAISAINSGRAPERSRNMAKAGLICGIIALSLTFLYFVFVAIMLITSP